MLPDHEITVTVAGATGAGKTNVALLVTKLLEDNGFVVDHQINHNEEIDLDGTEGTIVKLHEINLTKPNETIWDTTPTYESSMTQDQFRRMHMGDFKRPQLSREDVIDGIGALLRRDMNSPQPGDMLNDMARKGDVVFTDVSIDCNTSHYAGSRYDFKLVLTAFQTHNGSSLAAPRTNNYPFMEI